VSKERNKARKEQQAAQRAELHRKNARASSIRRAVGMLVIVAIVGAMGYCVVAEWRMSRAMVTASYEAGMHVPGRITYRESPPLGGPHNVVWQNCGVYGVPIHNEHAVHALEHGAIWITYRPDLAPDQVQQLTSMAGDDYMLLSPYPGLGSPIVASSWNHQIALERADDPQLRRFITNFKNNASSTPEFGAPCSGGTSAGADADTLNTGSGPMAR
jgi:hypothetical protein